MPTKITSPIFSINLDPQTNQLIPLNLLSADEISLVEETKYHQIYTHSTNRNSKQI